MLINSVRVRQFRNIGSLFWAPAPGINLISGANGQGKTNILEAIHFGLLGRSFRTHREEDCLPRSPTGAPPATGHAGMVELDLLNRLGTRKHRVSLGRDGGRLWKRAETDGQTLPRLGDLWQGVAAVAFSPADANIFREGPARRRRFLDYILCQLSPLYLEQLKRYQRALRQLNALLKIASHDAAGRRRQAEGFHGALAASASVVAQTRARHLGRLSEICAETYAQLGGSGKLEIGYRCGLLGSSSTAPARSFNDSEDEEPPAASGPPITLSPDDPALSEGAILTALAARYAQSERTGSLGFGPHRDDFGARLDGHDLARYGSQGQHRLSALALKLGAAAGLERVLGEAPVLLFDDFGSELDEGRRRAVLESLRGRMQVIITATRPEDLGPETLFDDIRRVEAGMFV